MSVVSETTWVSSPRVGEVELALVCIDMRRQSITFGNVRQVYQTRTRSTTRSSWSVKFRKQESYSSATQYNIGVGMILAAQKPDVLDFPVSCLSVSRKLAILVAYVGESQHGCCKLLCGATLTVEADPGEDKECSGQFSKGGSPARRVLSTMECQEAACFHSGITRPRVGSDQRTGHDRAMALPIEHVSHGSSEVGMKNPCLHEERYMINRMSCHCPCSLGSKASFSMDQRIH